jgi:Zn-dependent M28 family amino/carboxypeptidase
MTRFEDGLEPIPSAALSTIDAAQLARLVALDPHTRVRLALDCGMEGEYTSQNVIGEISGHGPRKDEVVVMGGHLDSWDPGTGAIDDAAGVGIGMAAGALLKPLHPQRTIRVIAFANEERGLFGGKAYAAAHAGEIAKHQFVSESDFGAGHIYSFNTNAPDFAKPAVAQIAEALEPLGIEAIDGEGGPESDVGPIAGMGAAWASLSHDGTYYFDVHHNAEDTLDKIDPKDLAQNVAAYAVFAWLAAQADGGFGSAPKAADKPGG